MKPLLNKLTLIKPIFEFIYKNHAHAIKEYEVYSSPYVETEELQDYFVLIHTKEDVKLLITDNKTIIDKANKQDNLIYNINTKTNKHILIQPSYSIDRFYKPGEIEYQLETDNEFKDWKYVGKIQLCDFNDKYWDMLSAGKVKLYK